MTANLLYIEAQKFGRDAGFLANVIMTQHSRPQTKLRGLVKLLNAGRECRTGQFAIDVLIIDGKRFGWEVLESPDVVKHWHKHAEAAV